MAAQSKQKTPRKLAVRLKRSKPKADDGGMVVFPTASGKLATTWIKNVDNIISEGTGNISVERLKVMQGKLKTALGLIEHRISEEEQKEAEYNSDSFKKRKLIEFVNNWVGKMVFFRKRDNDKSDRGIGLFVCSAKLNSDVFYINGIRYLGRHACFADKPDYDGAAMSTYSVNAKIDKISVIMGNGYYTLDMGNTTKFVIDVGKMPPSKVSDLVDFLNTTNETVKSSMNTDIAELQTQEIDICNKVKLKRKLGRPEPSSSK